MVLHENLNDRSDNDGTITREELRAALGGFGKNPTDAEIQHMMDKIDVNSDGTIDFDEFANLMASDEVDPNKELEEIFSFFDKDKSGRISLSELKETLQAIAVNVRDSDVEEMMREADADGDGQISFMGTFALLFSFTIFLTARYSIL